MDERFAIGSKVRFDWDSQNRPGLLGTILAVEDDTVWVRLDEERWRHLPPVPAARHELRPTES